MFDEPMDQDIYIFFSGDHLQTLALAESYFQAAKAGRYTVVVGFSSFLWSIWYNF